MAKWCLNYDSGEYEYIEKNKECLPGIKKRLL